MQDEHSKLETELRSDKIVFDYAANAKKREPSLRKVVILGAIGFTALNFIIALIIPAISSRKAMVYSSASLISIGATGVFWGFLMYWFMKWFQKRRWKETDFAAPIPMRIGRVLREIVSNHGPIGGKLVIGEKGLCFLPHRFLQWQGKVLTTDWAGTGRIYKSRGRFSLFRLFNGGLRDRLVIEIDGQDHFFVIDGIDGIIAELDDVRESSARRATGEEKP